MTDAQSKTEGSVRDREIVAAHVNVTCPGRNFVTLRIETRSGVTGLADRVTALDGRIRVSSPVGGPTLLHVEVPCRFA